MILKAYCTYDSAAGAYMQPWFVHNDALAVRYFSDTVNGDKGLAIETHPEHYSLYHVGEFDDVTGMFLPLNEPRFIGSAIEYIMPSDEQSVLDEIVKLKELFTKGVH